MILNYKVSNFALFNEQIELDMRKRKGEKNNANCINFNHDKILKSSIIYGANNSGKSKFLKSIAVLRDIVKKGNLDNFNFDIYANFLHEERKPIEFEVEFYDIETDCNYVYGLEIHGANDIVEYYLKDTDMIFYNSSNEKETSNRLNDLEKDILNRLSEGILFFSNYTKFIKKYNKVFEPLQRFFKKIRYVDFSFSDPTKTLMYLQLEKEILSDSTYSSLYNTLIRSADISLDGKVYIEEAIPSSNGKVNDVSLNLIEDLQRIQSLYTKYSGDNINKASIFFDSIGTQRFSRIIIEVIGALKENRILLIDEIDNSLHYKLVNEIIHFIHNYKDSNAQFLMTSHDVKLIDSSLFRKEQINIISRTKDNVELYSLAEFKSNSDVDLRPNANFEKFYTEGKFGGIPDPNFYDAIKAYEETLQKKFDKKN
ncbi:MAG: hypothetical protein KQ78_00341 [Candidatus Izimaplasma bacterium HR2]|nr:MAG: hypothetical protein KQ78_00341 [Candidatus Izimaplasma bacterium HR2]